MQCFFIPLFKFIFFLKIVLVFGGYEASSLSNSNAKRPKCSLINDKIMEEDEETSADKLSASNFSDNCSNSTDEFSKNLGTSVVSSSHDSSKQRVIPKCGNHFVPVGDDKLAIEMKVSSGKEMFEDKLQEDMLFKMPLLPLQRRRLSKLRCNIFLVRILILIDFFYR